MNTIALYVIAAILALVGFALIISVVIKHHKVQQADKRFEKQKREAIARLEKLNSQYQNDLRKVEVRPIAKVLPPTPRKYPIAAKPAATPPKTAQQNGVPASSQASDPYIPEPSFSYPEPAYPEPARTPDVEPSHSSSHHSSHAEACRGMQCQQLCI